MSPLVTEPKSWSFSPVLRVNLSSMPLSEAACFSAALCSVAVFFRQRAANPFERFLYIAGGGFNGQLFRQQKIARVTGLHVDDVAAVAELFDVFLENHFCICVSSSLEFFEPQRLKPLFLEPMAARLEAVARIAFLAWLGRGKPASTNAVAALLRFFRAPRGVSGAQAAAPVPQHGYDFGASGRSWSCRCRCSSLGCCGCCRWPAELPFTDAKLRPGPVHACQRRCSCLRQPGRERPPDEEPANLRHCQRTEAARCCARA